MTSVVEWPVVRRRVWMNIGIFSLYVEFWAWIMQQSNQADPIHETFHRRQIKRSMLSIFKYIIWNSCEFSCRCRENAFATEVTLPITYALSIKLVTVQNSASHCSTL